MCKKAGDGICFKINDEIGELEMRQSSLLLTAQSLQHKTASFMKFPGSEFWHFSPLTASEIQDLSHVALVEGNAWKEKPWMPAFLN